MSSLPCSKRPILCATALASLVSLASVSTTAEASPLTYAEGGDVVEDPGAGLPHVRYVDSASGDDDADGRTPATAWRTLTRVRAEVHSLPSGTHLLFRRGGRWNTGSLKISMTGLDGIVFGAYGPLDAPRPVVDHQFSFRNCSNITVRDLEVRAIHFSQGSHHGLVYNNVVHTMRRVSDRPNSVGIYITGGVHHMAVVRNLVYDIERNDGISIHDTNWGPLEERASPGPSHWILQNVVIGNLGMEENIDIATGQTREGEHDLDGTDDIKVIGNKLICRPVEGLNQIPGWGNGMAIIVAYEPRFVWLVGNTVSGPCPNRGIGVMSGEADGIQWIQISGNVVNATGGRSRPAIQVLETTNLWLEHNTLLHRMETNRPPLIVRGRGNLNVTYNLVASQRRMPPLTLFLVDRDHASNIDNNWYSYFDETEPRVDGMTFGEWRDSTGFDSAGGWGPVPGVEFMPHATDPREWSEEALRDHFAPTAEFSRCAGSETPGAYSCAGERLGTRIRPFEALAENGGYGWEGPHLVQHIYPLPSMDATCGGLGGTCCPGSTRCMGSLVDATDCSSCCEGTCVPLEEEDGGTAADGGLPDAGPDAGSDGGPIPYFDGGGGDARPPVEPTDASPSDGGPEGGECREDCRDAVLASSGCACNVGPGKGSPSSLILVLLLVAFRAYRRTSPGSRRTA